MLSLLAACGGASPRRGLSPDVPSTGPVTAPVLVEEFGDYQCGPCSVMGRRLHVVVAEEARNVRFVFRHCPSRAHSVGRLAALVAAAAAEDGRFWDLHWRLVDDGPIESEDHLWAVVEEAGLDVARLRGIIASGRPEVALARDVAEADRLGVRGLPTTFVDDQVLEGTIALDRLRGIVRHALGPSGATR